MRRNLFLTFLLLLTVTWSMGQKDPAKEKEAALQEAFQPVDLSKFVTTPVVQNKGSKAVLNEGFEGTTFPPDGWKVINGGDDNTWTRYTSTPITGTASASIFYSSTAHDDWLITPPLQVASGDAITFKAKNHNAGYLEEFHVKLSTTGNNAADFTVTLASNVAPPDTVTTYTYDLSAYAGQVVYVALQAISTDMWRLYVDDFSGPTIYIPPTDLMVTGLNKDYRLIPIGQLNPALELSTRVKNNGQDLNDAVNATVEVLDAANTVLFTSTDAVSVPLAYNTQTTVTAATPFNATALTVGSYSYKHQVTYATDYNPTDNTDVFNFQVTDYLYAKDAGVVAGGVGSSSATITLGNKFQIFTDAILSGVQIQWPAALAAGSLNFQVALYAVDGSNAVTSTVFTSGNLTRTQEMQGTTVTFPVTPVAIAPGTYILAVKQLTTTNIAIGFDGATAYGSFFIANNAANPTSFTANTLYGNLTLRMDLTPKRIVTFNVTDGTDPINNASITVKSGAVTVATGITNASGAAQVYVVDGNYTYTVTATGYTTISDQAFTVAGNGTVNVTMTIAPPAPGVEPYTWNYGSLHIETQSAKVFNVKNVGTGVLQVAPADITLGGDNADQFILTTLADTANLAMGQQAPFTVTFAPTSVGEKNAVIIVQGQTLATITGTAFDATINTFPYTQSFDDVTFPPLGWVNQKVAGTGIPGVWDRQTAGTNPTCSPIGTAMIRYNCFSLSGGTAGILVTPRIDFDDATDYAVVFKMYRDGMYATYLDKVEVYVNDQPNMTNATLLGTVHRSTTQAPTVSSNGWYDYSFSIPAAFYTNYAYVILKATSAYGNNIFVDEFG
ncbi:MAG TPA: choice-of-anchor J domain-containing protein, partial [Salinivirgaceae bacterium]|nr:choice-of-anchor J domain-containing protein [Salinivirgaceae bacterium]